jgi:hypothetical protein
MRVFDNKVLRRIFMPKRDEVTREWGRLHKKKIKGGTNMTGTNCDLFTHNQSRSYLNHLVCALYSSPNIIRAIKSRRLRWAGHVACMGEICIQGFGGEI